MPLMPEEILIKNLQGTANEEEKKILNNWLGKDKKNVEYYFQLEEIWAARIKISDEVISESWKRLSEEITKLPQNYPSVTFSGKNKIPAWLCYSAAIFLGILIASTIWLSFPLKEKLQDTETLVQRVVYNRSGVYPVVLPDGSEVWINENSQLTYPEKFDSQKRTVTLEGKAYFDIQKDLEKPFIVHAGGIDVEVTGTEFFIESVVEKESVVTLISGGVKIQYDSDEGEERISIPLKPGQQAVVNQQYGLMLTDIDPSYYIVWKDGVYRFNDEPLERVAEFLAKRFELDIQIASSLRKKRFTGKISSEESIQEVLINFNKSLPVKYHISDKTISIREF